MESIMVKCYVFECEDIGCSGTPCEECPLFKASPYTVYGAGPSDFAIIPAENLADFITKFGDIKLSIKEKENA